MLVRHTQFQKELMLRERDELMRQLKILKSLCQSSRGNNSASLYVALENKRGEVHNQNLDLSASIVRDCTSLDEELFEAQCEDWFMLVQEQHRLLPKSRLLSLSHTIRRAEMDRKIRAASLEKLTEAQQDLELWLTDRQKRFDVLREMVEQICAREMNWSVRLVAPPTDAELELSQTSVLGLLGRQLEEAGEPLPIG
mmetsp:Transcript_30253/g.69766  ORF Transcript_30253/g.69766 Transcript_30253/m.69766 type:complete len:197 (+) Transcript_30253:1002-1592(+)